jgi:hypothetical protein
VQFEEEELTRIKRLKAGGRGRSPKVYLLNEGFAGMQ